MKKILVFDLDETIGYFSQMYAIVNKFEEINRIKLNSQEIIQLLEYFHKVFRPGIFTYIAYLVILKKKYKSLFVLYTNTHLSDKWIMAIVKVINKHANSVFFDKFITLKSICRISVAKTLNDLVCCLRISNQEFNYMVLDNVYHHKLNTETCVYKIVKSFVYIYENKDVWIYLHTLKSIELSKQVQSNVLNNAFVSNSYLDILNLMHCTKQFLTIQ